MSRIQTQQMSQQVERQSQLADEIIGQSQSATAQMQSEQQRFVQPQTPSRPTNQQQFTMQQGRQPPTPSRQTAGQVRQTAGQVRQSLGSFQVGVMQKQAAQVPSSPTQQSTQVQQQQRGQTKQVQRSATPQMSAQASSTQQQAEQMSTHAQSSAEQQEEQDSDIFTAEVLNSKLKIESEKLMQWVMELKFVIKDLQRNLQESQEVRDRLKKNILEMQMELEQNSQKYQADKQRQEALAEKVQRTRSAFHVLYEHCQKVNESLENCCRVKDEIIQNHEAIKEYIATQKEPLQQAITLCHNRVKAMEELMEMQQKVHEVELEKAKAVCSDLEQKLQEAKQLTIEKSNQCVELENQLALSSKTVSMVTSEKEKTVSQMQQELKSALNTVKEKEALIKNKDLKIENLISQLKSSEQELNHVKLSYKKACLENSVMQSNLEHIKTDAEKFEGQRNTLTKQLDECKIQFQKLGEHRNILEKQLDESKNDIQKLKSENEAINIKLQEYSDTQKFLEDELSNTRNQLAHKSTEMNSLQSSYQKETEDLRAEIAFHKENYNKVAAKLHETEVIEIEVQRMLNEKDKTISDLSEQLQSLTIAKAEGNKKILELTARMSDIEKIIAEDSEHMNLLAKELETTKSNEEKLKSDISKKCLEIENEWKEKMSAEVERVIKEMEEANDNLRSQFTQDMRLQEEKYVAWREEVNTEIDQIRTEKDEITEMKTRLEVEISEKNELYRVVLEEKNTLATEMCDKEGTINKLQEALNALEKDKNETVSSLLKQLEEVESKRIQNLKDMLEKAEKDLQKFTNEISKKMEKISALESHLKIKDSHINDLNRKLKNTENALKEATLKKENLKTKDTPHAVNILKTNSASRDNVEIPSFESPLRATNTANTFWKKVTFEATDDSDVSVDLPFNSENKEGKTDITNSFGTETNKVALMFGKPKRSVEPHDPLDVFDIPLAKKTSPWKLTTTSSKRKPQSETTLSTQRSKSGSGSKFFKGRTTKPPDQSPIDFDGLNFDD